MTIGEELKNFRACEPLMIRLRDTLCIVAVVMLTITAHTMAFQDVVGDERTVIEERELRSGAVWGRIRLPAAEPIFESAVDLLRLTPPVQCVRMEGIDGMGKEWIRSWGDGELPPMTPTCVNARRT